MNSLRPLVATTVAALLCMPAGFAQDVPKPSGPPVIRNYRLPDIPAVNLANSGRLDALVKAGKIYLSLDDAIALALENNLDIEISRYGPQMAQSDLLRAKAGGLLRGVPTAVTSAASSAQSQVTGGATGGTTATTASSSSSSAGGTVISATGVSIPNYDPTFYFSGSAGHRSSPQSNTVTTGTTALISDNRNFQSGLQQSFATGTTYSMAWNNTWFRSNNYRSDINPGWNPNISLQVTQRLLQGWGVGVNNRNIRVAKNNIRISDLTFKLQVMTTVAGVVNLYWDLVSFHEDLKVKQKALEVAKKFYEDNKKQVAIGTLAPIEIVRAEANVASAEQNLTNSETALLQQETIVKNALSRTGVVSPTLAEARVIPTDKLVEPVSESIEKLQDLISTALAERPDLMQTAINLDSSKIGLGGSKSQLRPSLDFQASFTNNGLAGPMNTVPSPAGTAPVVHNVDPFFQGGYATALGQIFRRNFPDYSIAMQLSMPLRNRSAQADYIRDTLSLRQAELQQQKQRNDIRVSVQNALIAVIQARGAYQSAVKQRVLQEQTLDAENKKYALGASTAFQVVQTQRDLAQAQAGEVAALAAYSRARTQLDLSTAQVLSKYKVDLVEAKAAKSSRPYSSPAQ